MRLQRHRLVQNILGELARYWIVCCLAYFLAVGAELDMVKFLLELYIIGLPLALITLFMLIFFVALYLFALNHWQWQRPIYYVGFGEEQERIRRLSITDLTPADVDFRHLYSEANQHELYR